MRRSPLDALQNALIKGMQKHVEIDEPEEDAEIEIGAQQWPTELAQPVGDGGRGRRRAPTRICGEELFVADDDAVGLTDDVSPDLAEGGSPTPGKTL